MAISLSINLEGNLALLTQSWKASRLLVNFPRLKDFLENYFLSNGNFKFYFQNLNMKRNYININYVTLYIIININ